jgi:hypothetical protein
MNAYEYMNAFKQTFPGGPLRNDLFPLTAPVLHHAREWKRVVHGMRPEDETGRKYGAPSWIQMQRLLLMMLY